MWSSQPVRGYGNRVFLDFDGVVFRNKLASKHVVDRSVEWISKSARLSYNEAKKMNLYTYKIEGHTALFKGGSEEDLRSYNEFVFDQSFLAETLPECVQDSDVRHTNRLLQIARDRDLEYVLCTNAPRNYCERVLSLQGIQFSEMFHEDMVFSSDAVGAVKPTHQFYARVSSHLSDTTRIRFIDDSPINVSRANSHPNWRAILITEPEQLYERLESIGETIF